MKIKLATLCLTLFASTINASSIEQFPNQFSVKEFPCSAIQCFELTSATGERLGSLVPDEQKKSTYIYKMEQDKPLFTIQFKGFYLQTPYFNVYDNQGRYLGEVSAEANPLTGGSFFQTVLWELDEKIIKVRFGSNTLGSSHQVYVGATAWSKPSLAKISRPIFSTKTDSDVVILDRSQLFSVIEPDLFAALSAFHSVNRGRVWIDPQLQTMQAKVEKLAQKYSINKQADSIQLSMIADILHNRFAEQYQNVVMDSGEKPYKFVEFSCDLIESHVLNPEEERLALFYLQKIMTIGKRAW